MRTRYARSINRLLRTDGKRICSGCGEIKFLSDFYKDSPCYCKPCKIKMIRESDKRHAEDRSTKNRERMKKRYWIGKEDETTLMIAVLVFLIILILILGL